MADERDQWLDKDVAERLLRGEPFQAADARVGVRAKRLSDALRDVAAIAYANDGELPGEAAALTAFRRSAGVARAAGKAVAPVAKGVTVSKKSEGSYRANEAAQPTGAGRSGTARLTGASPGGADIGPAGVESSTAAVSPAVGPAPVSLLGPTVRLVPQPRSERPAVGTRALRMGLVAAVASCALAGMAVAAGGGVIPSELDAGHSPEKANAAPEAGAKPYVSGGNAGTGTHAAAPSVATATGQPTPDSGASQALGGPAKAAGDGRDATDEPIGPVGRHKQWSESAAPDQSGEWYRKTADACQDYRTGDIDPSRKEDLDTAAKSAAEAARFCDWLLAGGSGDGEEPGRGDSDSGGGKSGNGMGDGEVGGVGSPDGEIPSPSYEFDTPPPSPTLTVEPPSPSPTPPPSPTDPPSSPAPTATPSPSLSPSGA